MDTRTHESVGQIEKKTQACLVTVPGSEKGTPRGGWPLSSGLKYELDALADKGFRYLTKTYLPRKLKEEDWLD